MNFENFIQVEKISITKRPPHNAGLMKSGGIYLSFFGFRKRSKIFLYPSVVNAEELVCPGGHVDVVRLSLRPLLVHKSINGIISRRTLDETVHDLEKGPAQAW